MLVVHNTQLPEFTFQNNKNYICYHAVCESVLMGESLPGNIETNKKCADLATKELYGKNRKFHLSDLL